MSTTTSPTPFHTLRLVIEHVHVTPTGEIEGKGFSTVDIEHADLCRFLCSGGSYERRSIIGAEVRT